MKRLLAFLPVLALICVSRPAYSQQVPQAAQCVSAVGAAAAAVTCGPAISTTPNSNRLTAFTVMCGKASGSTSEAVVTITGLTNVLTFYIDESTTAPTFVAEDFTYPAVAPSGAAITISMPAVTSGGPCSCTACYVLY